MADSRNTNRSNANPTNLDPARETRPEDERTSPPVNDESEESMIVHRVNVQNPDGTPGVHEHGPMPVSEWAAYEKKNGL